MLLVRSLAPYIEAGQEGLALAHDRKPLQYTRGTILHLTFAVYRSHSSPYFARQTLSSSSCRVTMSAT